jgi:hypothetical protein
MVSQYKIWLVLRIKFCFREKTFQLLKKEFILTDYKLKINALKKNENWKENHSKQLRVSSLIDNSILFLRAKIMSFHLWNQMFRLRKTSLVEQKFWNRLKKVLTFLVPKLQTALMRQNPSETLLIIWNFS